MKYLSFLVENFERGKLQQMGGLGKAVVVFGGGRSLGR